MIQKLAIFLCVCFSFSFAFQAEFIDEKLQIGKLENGLTYYIRKNSYPEKKASFRLVVKVGSLYETDEEQGIAHFLEHLVFRGTKSYKDGQIRCYLESLGAWFGVDSNAFTSFDQTQYVIDIPIDEGIEKPLNILKEIAFDAQIQKEMVEKERGVVLDELHQRYSSSWHGYFRKLLESYFPSSLFPKRIVGGKKKIIETVDQKVIYDFYKKWYRPDRMAIIATGDFDAKQMVEKISKLFGSMVNPKNELEIPDTSLIVPTNRSVNFYYHPESIGTSLSLMYLKQSSVKKEFEENDLRTELIKCFLIDTLNKRLGEKQHKGEFLYAYASSNDFLNSSVKHHCLNAAIVENKVEETLQCLIEELARFGKYGVTKKEFSSIASSIKQQTSDYLLNLDKITNITYVSTYINHFMEGAPIVAFSEKARKKLILLEEITLSEINEFITKHLWNNYSLFINTSSKELYNNLDEKMLMKTLQKEVVLEKKENILDEVEFNSPTTEKGTVEQISYDEKNDIRHLILSNGIKVSLKKTDLEKGQFSIYGFAKRGFTSYSEKEYGSIMLCSSYGFQSGMRDFPYLDLIDLLTEKKMSFFLGYMPSYRYIMVRGPSEHMDVSFDLLNRSFQKNEFDQKQWDLLITNQKEYQKNLRANTDYQFGRFLNKINSQDHYLFREIDTEKTDRKLAEKVYDADFKNISDFDFLIVGDFEEDRVVENLERTVAGLEKQPKNNTSRSKLPRLFPDEKIEKDFKMGDNTYTTTFLTFPLDGEKIYKKYNNFYGVKAVCKILQNRLIEVLRDQLGATYGVGVFMSQPFFLDLSNLQIQVYFTSQAKDRDQMVELTRNGIQEMMKYPPLDQEIQTAKKLALETKKKEKLSNSYWLDNIIISRVLDVSLDNILDYQTHINALNKELLLETAKMMFISDNFSLITHHPKD